MNSKRISWANCPSYEEAQFVIVGIPDQSHSHSIRKGTAKAPDVVRDVSWERDVFEENGIESQAYSFDGPTNYQVFDYGNIKRDQISETFAKIISDGKTPITIGGDHSLTTKIIQTIGKKLNKMSLVYFDAHPDFLSSTTDFYGSVVYDILPYIDVKSSVMIGIRHPEKEEIENIKKYNFPVITPYEIATFGLSATLNKILETIGQNVYVSFDMDALDPSFAPGVSVPVPFGMNSIDAMVLVKEIVKQGAIGMDIMEICPQYDIQNFTSHLASRMVGETLPSIKIPTRITI